MSSSISQQDSRFKITRGAGSGTSLGQWPNQDKELPDSQAFIEFRKGYGFEKKFCLTADFGYTSPTGRNFSRDLDLNIEQTLELIYYLHTLVVEQLRQNK